MILKHNKISGKRGYFEHCQASKRSILNVFQSMFKVYYSRYFFFSLEWRQLNTEHIDQVFIILILSMF